MSDVGKISIDFAYLQLRKIIGHGASSEVYVGRYKSREVAIKVSNPPEITEEQIDGFVAEAKIASSLFHPNVVEFVGICVRPPQIAMVFEFCEGGNLKSSLTSSPHLWTPLRRIDACTDACRAISCMHNLRLIHRDLKAENFFVGAEQVVKLGDFGESTRFRSMESARTKRMTILGTVAFMAPELIAAHKHYTESIDIYALAVTMWEIWTGRDPYEDISQFEIYEKVAQGYRPGLPTDSPPGFNDILVSAWQEDAANRPTAAEMVEQLEELVKGFSEEQLDGLRQSSERPTGSNPLGGGGGDAGGGGAGSAGEGVAESAKAAGVAGVAGVAGAAGGARGAGAVEMQLNPLVSSSEVDDVAHRLSRVPSTHSRTNSTNSSASEKSPKVPPAVP
ncbi:kinase-like domain-containing protein [Ochromonadaceae sp. CCMP2298]|nr:kinase-like domain-containing protein [Ochromonadaceae sp. CCMP2298]